MTISRIVRNVPLKYVAFSGFEMPRASTERCVRGRTREVNSRNTNATGKKATYPSMRPNDARATSAPVVMRCTATNVTPAQDSVVKNKPVREEGAPRANRIHQRAGEKHQRANAEQREHRRLDRFRNLFVRRREDFVRRRNAGRMKAAHGWCSGFVVSVGGFLAVSPGTAGAAGAAAAVDGW